MWKIYLFHLFNMVLIMTITPKLCGMVGSLHKKIPAAQYLQSQGCPGFWCGNLQLKTRFEWKLSFLKRFWCAEWNQKYLESNFTEVSFHNFTLIDNFTLSRAVSSNEQRESWNIAGKKGSQAKELTPGSTSWDPAKLGLFPQVFNVCHIRAVMLIIPEEQWTSSS